MESIIIDTKMCCRCKKEFPLNEEFFHVSNFLKDGFNSHCKDCRKKSYHLRRKPENNLDKLLKERMRDIVSRTKSKRVRHTTEIDFDIDFLKKLWDKQEGKCNISGIPMTHILHNGAMYENVSIDRIDSLKGYTKDNIQLVCCIINKMKLDMSSQKLIDYCSKIIKHNEL